MSIAKIKRGFYMEIEKKLSNVKVGEKVIVCNINSSEKISRRLFDIGIIKNTVIECVGKSPLGDPSAYLIRGAVIALRSEDSENIIVRKASDE